MEKRNVATSARVKDDGMDDVMRSVADCLAAGASMTSEMAKAAREMSSRPVASESMEEDEKAERENPPRE